MNDKTFTEGWNEALELIRVWEAESENPKHVIETELRYLNSLSDICFTLWHQGVSAAFSKWLTDHNEVGS